MAKILVNLDLTEIGRIGREMPDYVKEVTFKNGERRKFLNIVVAERKEEDKQGNNYTVYAYKNKEHKDDDTVWLGKGKTMGESDGASKIHDKAEATQAPQGGQESDDEFPF